MTTRNGKTYDGPRPDHDGGRDDEEFTVTDKRRFHPDGQRRDDDTEGGTGAAGTQTTANSDDTAQRAEPVVEPEVEPEPEPVVPLRIAEEWERRAIEAEGKIREITDAYRHHKAELDATRVRLERDREVRVAEALGRSFLRILEALDGLEFALAHAPDGPLAEGVRLVQRKMQDALAAEGVERIDALGEAFDPTIHDAVAMIPVTDDTQVSTIVGQMRPGYRFRDKVLRAPQVHVGTRAPQA